MKKVLESFLVDKLDVMLDKLEVEIEDLLEELRVLANNRKRDFFETQAILFADSHLNAYIERIGALLLSGKLPKRYNRRLNELFDKLKSVREFIYDHFADVFEEPVYSVT